MAQVGFSSAPSSASPFDNTTPKGSLFTSTNVQEAIEELRVLPLTVLTDAASIVFDAGKGLAYTVSLGGNRTLANPTNLVPGLVYTISVIQDNTGNRTLAYDTTYQFPLGVPPTLSIYPTNIDILQFYSDGTYLSFINIMRNVQTPVLAPTGLVGTPIGGGVVNLSWTNNSPGQTSTSLEVNTTDPNTEAFWGVFDTVGAGVNTDTDNGETPNSTVWYRVFASRNGANSTVSDYITVNVT